MRHVSRKVHFDLEDPDADDIPELIPWTFNANLKFVDELEKEKRFFELPAFYDDNGEEVKPRSKPRKKPPNPCMGGTVIPPKSILPKKPDCNALRPHFGYLPVDWVKATIETSTQWFKHEGCERLCAACKTQFLAANVERLNETVAFDTLFSNTPTCNDGVPGNGGV